MLVKDLIDFGLSEKEATVYIALLELEIAPVQEIAKKSRINRSSTYVVLESLKEKGLISTSNDKSVRQYIATPPEILARMADNLAEKQERVRKNINNLVPELKALFKGTKKKPIVKVFEGKEGLISAFEDTLNNREKLMRVASSLENLNKMIPNYLREYLQKRYTLGIKMKGIHPDDKTTRALIKVSSRKFDTPIPIPKNKYKLPADLAIYDDKIGYMTAENGGIAIIIQNKGISDVMKNVFDLAWEEVKRLNQLNDKVVKKNKK